MSDGSHVEILNIIDDHSRLCIASVAQRVFKAADVQRCFRHAAAVNGNPTSVLSDNGAVSTGRYRGQGRVALEATLHARAVAFSHSRPYHPQTCGKVERFHQTVNKWLASQPPAASATQLQAQPDTFQAYQTMNNVPRHQCTVSRDITSAEAVGLDHGTA